MPYEIDSDILFYDTLGSYNSYGFSDSICYGLVKFSASSNCSITKVGSFINHGYSNIQGVIYKSFNDISQVLSDTIGIIGQQNCIYAGYYTFDLENPVKVTSGEDFYVMIKYNTPADTMPLPVENYIKGYSDPHLTSGKCWINPNYKKWPTTWYECGTSSPYESLNYVIYEEKNAKFKIQ